VIGCRVKEGVVKKGGKCYIVRGDDIISEGRITSLRTQKDTINEAKTGQEFGAIFDSKVEAEVGDTLYCYKVIK
jgi:translation initiation factor IF-2